MRPFDQVCTQSDSAASQVLLKWSIQFSTSFDSTATLLFASMIQCKRLYMTMVILNLFFPCQKFTIFFFVFGTISNVILQFNGLSSNFLLLFKCIVNGSSKIHLISTYCKSCMCVCVSVFGVYAFVYGCSFIHFFLFELELVFH